MTHRIELGAVLIPKIKTWKKYHLAFVLQTILLAYHLNRPKNDKFRVFCTRLANLRGRGRKLITTAPV